MKRISYQSASKLHDHRLGLSHDFRSKQGVFEHGLVLPADLKCEPESFWNQVELHHRRHDAVVGRELKIALPKQLSTKVRTFLVKDISKEIARRFNVAVAYATHEPRYFTEGEVENNPYQFWEFDEFGRMSNGNWHAHLTVSACTVKNESGAVSLGTKCVELDPIHCKRAGIANFAEQQRIDICKRINGVLAYEKIDIRYDHRSYRKQGRIDIPGIHLGPEICAIERKLGKASKRRIIDEDRKSRLRKLRKIELEAQRDAEQTALLIQQRDELLCEIFMLEEQLEIESIQSHFERPRG